MTIPAAEAAYQAIRHEYSCRGMLFPNEAWMRILAEGVVKAVTPPSAAEAYMEGVKAERTRITELATTEAATMRASNWAEHEAICAAALEDFAAELREQP